MSLSLPLSSVSEEAILFAFLSNVCFFSIASMVLCTSLLRGFVGLQQRGRLREQQQQSNGDAIDEEYHSEKSIRVLSSHRDYIQLRHRNPQQGSALSVIIENEEIEKDRKARKELASELQALKELQVDVKAQLAMLQGIVLATKKTPSSSQQANPRNNTSAKHLVASSQSRER